MLTVAVTGVSTPLLAVHWYWIMLSAVPGLSTITGTDGVSAITMALPTLVHAILGFGLPDAVQVKFNLSPSTAVAVLLDISTDGGTETKIEPLKVMDKPKHVSRLSKAPG